jgi:hypothetical protein
MPTAVQEHSNGLLAPLQLPLTHVEFGLKPLQLRVLVAQLRLFRIEPRVKLA